jgi:NAD(P)-dependent dehydrogenase (short-subunit alcohol dehydrogenase family)
MRLKPINQQVIVVVGANSGIGRATALLAAKRGARVVISGRDQEALDALAEEIRERGGMVLAAAADVSRYEDLEALAEKAAQTYGGVDTWVHSAAVMMYAAFRDTRPEEFRRMIEVNLLGQIYGARAALPHLKREERGVLIHISSIEASRALPYQSAYAASKHGMTGFLDALRLEMEAEGAQVSVTNIKPSGINTPLYDKALTRLGVKPRPVAPIYEPETVAEAILYAAENPVRDLEVGGAGKSLALAQRLSPRLADRILKKIAFDGQRTDIPKTDHAPNNLFEHMEGYDRVKGEFSDEARETSLYTSMRRKPYVRIGIAATGLAALSAALMLASRARRPST